MSNLSFSKYSVLSYFCFNFVHQFLKIYIIKIYFTLLIYSSTRNIPTPNQKEHLYRFMENNMAFALGNYTNNTMHSIWTKLVAELNAIPDGADRSVSEWKKVRFNFLYIKIKE